MSFRFTLLFASLILATACSSSADSADKTTAAKTVTASPVSVAAAPTALPVATSAAPIVLAQATVTAAAAPSAATPAAAGSALYTVVDKNKVDPNTLMGWKTWRAQACERCHGAAQEGLVGPSLVNSLKVLTKDEFMTTLKNGRIEKGMPNFGGIPNVVDNLDNLYAYLKGRSDGAIAAGRLEAISK
ncbi:MAG: c-type cytochrome [Herminiimonas sp.]|nr:c-type cytochrome [Herminiimonas sp.]